MNPTIGTVVKLISASPVPSITPPPLADAVGFSFDQFSRFIGFIADLSTVVVVVSALGYLIFQRKSDKAIKVFRSAQSLALFLVAIFLYVVVTVFFMSPVVFITAFIGKHAKDVLKKAGVGNYLLFGHLIGGAALIAAAGAVAVFLFLGIFGILMPLVDKALGPVIFNQLEVLRKKKEEDEALLSALSYSLMWTSIAHTAKGKDRSKVESFIGETLDQAITYVFGSNKHLFRASIMEPDISGSGDLRIAYERGLSAKTASNFVLRPKEGIAGHVMETSMSRIIEDVGQEATYKRDPDGKNKGSLLCLPVMEVDLSGKGKPIAVFSISSDVPRQFTERHIKRFAPFADAISIMLRCR